MQFNKGDKVVKVGDSNRWSQNPYAQDGWKGTIKEIQYASGGELYYIVNFNQIGDVCVSPTEITLERSSKMLNDINQFYKKHQDIVFTVAAVLLLDYFLFNGAFRQKITDIVNKGLDCLGKKVSDGQA